MDNEVPSACLEGRGDRDGKDWAGDRVPSYSFRRERHGRCGVDNEDPRACILVLVGK